MKKSVWKPVLICLCVLLIGSVGAAVYALTGEPTEQSGIIPSDTVSVDGEERETFKDETVYVLAGADGAVQKIIVSDWIQNALGNAALNDKSELSEVENVKGNESYTMNGDTMRVWDAQGNDIYYQGTIEKELPVNLSVSYTLDGKPISPDELAGKSGHVVIRFSYQNNQYETVEIDGKPEKIYVPFVMLTGMLLDTDVFRNVDVSNGKLINDGDHIAVIGIAFPGLQHNLAIEKEKLEIPDTVEISADVENFEMTATMTVATNEWCNEFQLDELDSMDSLTDSLAELTDAMSRLTDGSSQLYDGLCTLLEKSDELIAGINQLTAGAKALKDGAGNLDAGAAQLQAGTATLYAGLYTLSSNNDSLNGGAKQVFETLLSNANAQLAAAGLAVPTLTIDTYAEVLNGVIASLDETAVYEAALAQVTAAVKANRPLVESRVTEAVKEQVMVKVTAAVQTKVTEEVTAAVREAVADQVIPAATNGQLTKEAYDTAVAAGIIDPDMQAAIEDAVDAQMHSDSVKQMIEQNVSEQMSSAVIQNTIAAGTAEQMQEQEVIDAISETVEMQIKQAISENMLSDAVQEQLKTASEGAASIISLKASLDSYNTFYLGLLTYTNGVADAAAGAGELESGAAALKEGTEALSEGTAALYDGILQLRDGIPALIDGIEQLRDGAMKLSDGLKEFDEQGIQKLAEVVDGDLSGLITRVRATVDVSKNYRSFSGLSEEMDGQVKFIYRTASVKVAE